MAEGSVWGRVVGAVGIVLYLGAGFFYLASGLVVPGPWVFLLWAVWLLGWWPVIRLFMRNPVWVPAVGLGAFVFWWLFVTLGSWLFGWSA
jgi:hypothetical protein